MIKRYWDSFMKRTPFKDGAAHGIILGNVIGGFVVFAVLSFTGHRWLGVGVFMGTCAVAIAWMWRSGWLK